MRDRGDIMAHGTKPTILLIEADRSLRRLIALGLQQRGMQIIEANSPAQLNIPEGQSPALLVLDIDSGASSDWSLLSALDALPELSTIPMVVLTWDVSVPADIPEDFVDGVDRVDGEERLISLSKPFDARTLYATIEQLLVVDTARKTGLTYEAYASERSVSTVTVAPSIWPLLTAVGLLLVFIGLMGVLSLIIIGLCIVLVSLLWWTLGTKPKRVVLPV